jgi:hypothetical protein
VDGGDVVPAGAGMPIIEVCASAIDWNPECIYLYQLNNTQKNHAPFKIVLYIHLPVAIQLMSSSFEEMEI